jgi:hypothetical protein
MNNDTIQENPFVYGKMIKDPEKFWGRSDECYRLRTRLYNIESTSVVGPRRIGKSSLAYFVYSTSKQNFDDSYQFVWLDGQSNHARSLQDFCLAVTSKCSIAYVPANNPKDCLKNFEDAISDSGKKIVLIINEFELLTDEAHSIEFDISFFNTLRFLAEQCECALITTSNKPIQELCMRILGVSSPFYNILPQITLSNFSDDEANGFLIVPHNGITLDAREVEIIKAIPNYQHPLVLQVACHHALLNRKLHLSKTDMVLKILEQSNYLLNHGDVHKERLMAKKSTNQEKKISKPLDLLLSILVPVVGIGLLMGEFAWLMRNLDIAQTIILAIFSALVGFAVMIFAGRSIDIIGETTFFKLFTRLIEQIPLLSNVLTTITDAVKKSKK